MLFSQQIQIPTAECAAYDSTQIYYKLTTSLNTYNETHIRFDEIFISDAIRPLIKWIHTPSKVRMNSI